MINYKEIYEKSFDDQKYNQHPDNEFRFKIVEDFVLSNKTNSVIDIGSGRGNIIKMLGNLGLPIHITSTDLKKFHDYNCDFYEINLCDDSTFSYLGNNKYELLTCLDVMEHVEHECVDKILHFFSKISKNAILTIANHSDIQNGVELHVIQENMSFWKPKLEEYFDIIGFDEKYSGRLYLLTLKSKNND
jgi:2-polyprenyl-3-methyl-5-hydroxy-6-metoxy-1,4-benzoquinol methylase